MICDNTRRAFILKVVRLGYHYSGYDRDGFPALGFEHINCVTSCLLHLGSPGVLKRLKQRAVQHFAMTEDHRISTYHNGSVRSKRVRKGSSHRIYGVVDLLTSRSYSPILCFMDCQGFISVVWQAHGCLDHQEVPVFTKPDAL